MLPHFRGSSIRSFPEFRIVNTLHSSVPPSALHVPYRPGVLIAWLTGGFKSGRRHIQVFTLPRNREAPIFHRLRITCRFRSGRN